jgi:hypothetical protein
MFDNPPSREWSVQFWNGVATDHRATSSFVLAIAALFLLSMGVPVLAGPLANSSASSVSPNTAPLQILGFSFSPSTVSQGSQSQGSIQLSGGTPPYYAWLNNSPPGCQPPTVPYVTSNPSNTFSCQPSGTGVFNVHLDVSDSSNPTGHQSQSTTLTVNGNSNSNGNGSGNGNNNNGSKGGLSLPGGLLYLVTIFGIVFLGAVVAIAAGVIATAVVLSRRIRQVNETLAAQQKSMPPSKPPT